MPGVKKVQEMNIEKYKIKGKFTILQFMLLAGSLAMIAATLLRYWLA